VVTGREIKSISSEKTLLSDTVDLGMLKSLLGFHAENVARRLRKEGLKGKTITIKITFSDFHAITKSHTIDEATDSSSILKDSAIKLLLDYPLKKKVRLIGVAVSNLEVSKEDSQIPLFMLEGKEDKERKVDKAMDEIRKKFGGKVIKKGKD
jgi:DNA polymerase-4